MNIIINTNPIISKAIIRFEKKNLLVVFI